MSAAELAALLGAGILAGIVSTVASLASVVSYPALLAVGLSPVSANVTNTVALMFTAVGAAAGSRPELAGQGLRVRRLGVLTAAGGGAGAALLLLTPRSGFEYVAPLLIAGGSALILLRPVPEAGAGSGTRDADTPGGGILDHGTLGGSMPGDAGQGDVAPAGQPEGDQGWFSRAGVFAVAVYVGYFGAAAGILMLAVLLRVFRESLARSNALKNVISGLANGVAGIGFAIFGPVRWEAALPLAAGFLAGGWIGPALVRRLPASGLRIFIGLAGLAVASWLGARYY